MSVQRCASVLILGVMATACLPVCAAGTGQNNPCNHTLFPPTQSTPRDPWQAAELYRLLEQADPLPVEYPDLWARMRAEQNRLPLSRLDQGDPEALRSLICALWADYGTPELNEANQWFLAGAIAEGAEHVAAADPSTRRALAEELLRYLDAGGAAVEPEIPALIGRSLAVLVPEDNEIRNLGEQLVADAVQWEVEIAAIRGEKPSDEVLRCGYDVLGPLFALEAYEMLEHPPAGPHPACYRRASIAIAAVLDAFGQCSAPPSGAELRHLAQRLRAARRLVLRPCGSEETREDLQCRLAVALRTLLRSRRLPADPRILNEINRTLLELLRRHNLSGPRAWRYWADAVLALGPSRISDQLASELNRRLSSARADHALGPDMRNRVLRLSRQRLHRDADGRQQLSPGKVRPSAQPTVRP